MAELIIVFREVLEASLIVGILYTYLNQTNQKNSIATLWQGVIAALVASVIGSFLFQKLAGGFQGQAEKLSDGSYPLFHDKGHIGSLFKGLFGYNGDPSLIELLSWFITASGLGFMWRKASLETS